MSCRVLGRGVETMVLRAVLAQARASGVEKLRGTFRPTERNRLVVDHYAKLGFSQTGTEADGTTHWELSVAGCEPAAAPMKVVSIGF
jgi:predicted enzyme involved in methoxymalonyl-ACP biosynthesis